MVVGVCQMRLSIHAVFSLKEKRGIVRRITGRVRAKFQVAIAEVDDNDLLTSAVIGICAVGNDRAFINSVLDKVIRFIDELYLAEVVDQQIEIMNM
ncbi:MAG: DUF503 domain-containing protein [Deltaproteobacteria bacterium]|nr:DUF503 domain-containing protein [Deltaproteobacteria bacterium]